MNPTAPGRPARLSHERRILLMAMAAGLPGTALGLWLLWQGDFTPKVQWTLTVVVLGFWLGFCFAVREHVVRPLQTLSNLLSALREGDFSIRGREVLTDDALGLAMVEANQLAEVLRMQRLGAVEANVLLSKLMAEIDVAVFAFDGKEKLRLVNHDAEQLLGRPAEDLLGKTAAELNLEVCLRGSVPRILDVALPGGSGRWEVRRGTFRQGGRPHQLVFLSDLTRTLQDEERQAWQRLLKVLRHEIGNSLAPIQSLSDSLRSLVIRDPRPADWEDDLQQGLAVIAERSGALSRFMSAYSRLMQLPAPNLEPLEVDDWVQRVVALETRLDIEIAGGPAVTLRADSDQLDQLLINLVTNAVDAALETEGGVRVSWSRVNGASGSGNHLEVRIDDEGPGLPDSPNLFVPFFTTKPQGSGIGLVLSRQIAEAHGGVLTLENRGIDIPGCRARLRLPV